MNNNERSEVKKLFETGTSKLFKEYWKRELKSKKIYFTFFIILFLLLGIELILDLINKETISTILIDFLSILITWLFILIPAILVSSYLRILKQSYKLPKNIKQTIRIERLQIITYVLLLVNAILILTLVNLVKIEVFSTTMISLLLFSHFMDVLANRKGIFEIDYHMFFIENDFLDITEKTKIEEEIKKRKEQEEFPLFLREILIRCAKYIEFKIYPFVEVKLRDEEYHRLYLSVINNEEIIISQLSQIILSLNKGEWISFYNDYHHLIQLLRSENITNPTNSYLFLHRSLQKKVISGIKLFISNNFISGIFVGVVVIFLTYYITVYIL